MTTKELAGMGRLVARALKMARRIVEDAEAMGLQAPPKRRRRRKEKEAAEAPKPKRVRGAKTPLRAVGEEE